MQLALDYPFNVLRYYGIYTDTSAIGDKTQALERFLALSENWKNDTVKEAFYEVFRDGIKTTKMESTIGKEFNDGKLYNVFGIPDLEAKLLMANGRRKLTAATKNLNIDTFAEKYSDRYPSFYEFAAPRWDGDPLNLFSMARLGFYDKKVPYYVIIQYADFCKEMKINPIVKENQDATTQFFLFRYGDMYVTKNRMIYPYNLYADIIAGGKCVDFSEIFLEGILTFNLTKYKNRAAEVLKTYVFPEKDIKFFDRYYVAENTMSDAAKSMGITTAEAEKIFNHLIINLSGNILFRDLILGSTKLKAEEKNEEPKKAEPSNVVKNGPIHGEVPHVSEEQLAKLKGGYAEPAVEETKKKDEDPLKGIDTKKFDPFVSRLSPTIKRKLYDARLCTLKRVLQFYNNNDGDFTKIPGITDDEHEIIVAAANDLGSAVLIEAEEAPAGIDADTATQEELVAALNAANIKPVARQVIKPIEVKAPDPMPVMANDKPAVYAIPTKDIYETVQYKPAATVKPAVVFPTGYDDGRLVPDDDMVAKLADLGILTVEDCTNYPLEFFVCMDGMTTKYVNLLKWRVSQAGLKFNTVEEYTETIKKMSSSMVTPYDLLVIGMLDKSNYNKISEYENLAALENIVIDRIPNISSTDIGKIRKAANEWGVNIYTAETFRAEFNNDKTDCTVDTIMKYLKYDSEKMERVNDRLKAILLVHGETVTAKWVPLSMLKQITKYEYIYYLNNTDVDEDRRKEVAHFFEDIINTFNYRFNINLTVSVDYVQYNRELDNPNGLLAKINPKTTYQDIEKYVIDNIKINDTASDEISEQDVIELITDILYYMPNIKETILTEEDLPDSYQKAIALFKNKQINVIEVINGFLRAFPGFRYIMTVLFVRYILACKDYDRTDFIW